MKKTQPAPPCTDSTPARNPQPDERARRRQALLSTAEILARGVTLDQVQKAVNQLRPQIHKVG